MERRASDKEVEAERTRVAQIEREAREASRRRDEEAEALRRAEATMALRERAATARARPLLGLTPQQEVVPVLTDSRGRVITGLSPDDLEDLHAILRHSRSERRRERPADALDTIAGIVARVLRRHGESTE